MGICRVLDAHHVVLGEVVQGFLGQAQQVQRFSHVDAPGVIGAADGIVHRDPHAMPFGVREQPGQFLSLHEIAVADVRRGDDHPAAAIVGDGPVDQSHDVVGFHLFLVEKHSQPGRL